MIFGSGDALQDKLVETSKCSKTQNLDLTRNPVESSNSVKLAQVDSFSNRFQSHPSYKTSANSNNLIVSQNSQFKISSHEILLSLQRHAKLQFKI